MTPEAVKYSAIIPVYNAERTVERCLNSIIANQRNDIEIIIVNDGSTDQSGQIISNFIDNNKSEIEIVYIEQPNSGVSKARNTGLDIARGEYITFVDSDDYVLSNYFETLDSMNNSDLCVFGFVFSDTVGDIDFTLQEIEKNSDMSKVVEMLVSSRKIMAPINKKFKNDLIKKNNLRFIEDFQIGEDFDFCLSYTLKCRSVSITSKAIYCVDISDTNSLSRKYRPELDKKMSNVFKHIENTVLAADEGTERIIDTKLLLTILDYLFVKNTFTCIAEEFKYKKPCYSRDKEKFAHICQVFRYSLIKEKGYYNVVHRTLRFLLKRNLVFPFYIVTYFVKWKAFKKYLREDEK